MEDYLSATNYMGKPVFSKAVEYDDTCSQKSGWDSLVDLIANNCESSFSLSPGCQSYSSLVSDDTFVDEELEDTASSPLQSPKLVDLNYLYTKSKETYREENCQDHHHNGHTSLKAGEVGIGFIETELRRKGLCLVPISMLLSPS